ncbi:MAG TPA: exonuclease SbcCD subunit D [Clostridiaceae bacterium]|nr:exonuclease SbcCD subunit D [Clostridiaceae bacterium]
MKFFHLADLHLGRTLHKYSLIEDQKYFLDFVIEQTDQYNPDAIVIAGDIYDRAIPSAEATQLFDYFLTELSKRDCLLLIISGNHDSATRLSYARDFFREFNIYIATEAKEQAETIALTSDQTYYFHLIPFFKPATIKNIYPEAEIETYSQALTQIISSIDLSLSGKHILVAHQFFVNQSGAAIVSDSEQLSVGGLDQIQAELVKDFDYVALGHLHQPHHVQYENIRYSGSPLVYSASELARPKFLSMIEMNGDPGFKLHKIPFEPLHPVCLIEGNFTDLINSARENPSEDYVYISLSDYEPIPDLAIRFKRFYPRLLEVRTPHFNRSADSFNALSTAPSELSISQLFALFHEEETGKAISDTDQKIIRKLEEKVE